MQPYLLQRKIINTALTDKEFLDELIKLDENYFTDYLSSIIFSWIKIRSKNNQIISLTRLVTESNLSEKQLELLADAGKSEKTYNNDLLKKIKDSWPDPIPFFEINNTSLPVDILPEWLKCYVNSLSGSDVPELDIQAKNIYNKGMSVLLNTKPPNIDSDGNWIPHILKLSPGALESRNNFDEFIENQLSEGGELSHISDWGGKLVGQALRIAGLLHIAEHINIKNETDNTDFWNKPISKDTMEKAIKLGKSLSVR